MIYWSWKCGFCNNKTLLVYLFDFSFNLLLIVSPAHLRHICLFLQQSLNLPLFHVLQCHMNEILNLRLSQLSYHTHTLFFQDNFMISRLVKMFRAARLIKLLNYGGEMRTLLFVFLKALKSLPHVMFLVMLTFYIYAIIGMQIFGKVEADPDNSPDYVITRYNNFESFQNAMILLFRWELYTCSLNCWLFATFWSWIVATRCYKSVLLLYIVLNTVW